jgi:hypothetical protein
MRKPHKNISKNYRQTYLETCPATIHQRVIGNIILTLPQFIFLENKIFYEDFL